MLYVIIALIIKTHNKMIESFYSVHAKRLPYVLPEKPAEISPRETTLEDAIPSCKLTEYVYTYIWRWPDYTVALPFLVHVCVGGGGGGGGRGVESLYMHPACSCIASRVFKSQTLCRTVFGKVGVTELSQKFATSRYRLQLENELVQKKIL